MSYRLEHTADLAVTAFGDGDPVPTVGALAAAVFHGAKGSHAILQRHAFQQALLFLGAQRTQHADRIFTLQPEAWVHQLVRKLPRTGE